MAASQVHCTIFKARLTLGLAFILARSNPNESDASSIEPSAVSERNAVLVVPIAPINVLVPPAITAHGAAPAKVHPAATAEDAVAAPSSACVTQS